MGGTGNTERWPVDTYARKLQVTNTSERPGINGNIVMTIQLFLDGGMLRCRCRITGFGFYGHVRTGLSNADTDI